MGATEKFSSRPHRGAEFYVFTRLAPKFKEGFFSYNAGQCPLGTILGGILIRSGESAACAIAVSTGNYEISQYIVIDLKNYKTVLYEFQFFIFEILFVYRRQCRFIVSTGLTPEVKMWVLCFDKSRSFREVSRALELGDCSKESRD